MKRRNIALAACGTLVAAWVLVVPGLVGMYAAADMDQTTLELQQLASKYPLTVKVEQFRRGWFSSSVTSRYTMNGSAAGVVVRHDINQFAIPFYRWAMVTHTISSMDQDGVVKPLPFVIDAHSRRAFFGGMATTVLVPDLNWHGDGGFRMSGKNLALRSTGKLGGLQEVEFQLPALEIGIQNETIKLTKLSIDASSQTGAADTTWVQQARIKLEGLEATGANGKSLRLTNTLMNVDMKDHGEKVDLIYQTKSDQGVFGATNAADAASFNDFHLDFSYNNLNKAALLKLNALGREYYANAAKAMVTQSATDAESPDAGVDNSGENPALRAATQKALYDGATLLLSGSPGFKVDRLSLTTGSGRIDGALEINFDGRDLMPETFRKDFGMTLLKTRLSGKLSVNLPRALVLDAFGGTAPAVAATTESHDLEQDQMITLKRQMIDSQISNYVEQGYLKEDGKQLMLESIFSPQGIQVGGKKMM